MCHPYGGTSEWRHTAASLDATTARTYLRRRCHFSRNEDAVELFVRSHFGRESSEVNSRINLSQFLWSCYLLDLQISMLYLLTYMASAGGVYKLLGPEKNKADTVYVKGSQFSHFETLGLQTIYLWHRRRSNHLPEAANAIGSGQCPDESTGVLRQHLQRPCLHRDKSMWQNKFNGRPVGVLEYEQKCFFYTSLNQRLRLRFPKVCMLG